MEVCRAGIDVEVNYALAPRIQDSAVEVDAEIVLVGIEQIGRVVGAYELHAAVAAGGCVVFSIFIGYRHAPEQRIRDAEVALVAVVVVGNLPLHDVGYSRFYPVGLDEFEGHRSRRGIEACGACSTAAERHHLGTFEG